MNYFCVRTSHYCLVYMKYKIVWIKKHFCFTVRKKYIWYFSLTLKQRKSVVFIAVTKISVFKLFSGFSLKYYNLIYVSTQYFFEVSKIEKVCSKNILKSCYLTLALEVNFLFSLKNFLDEIFGYLTIYF